MTGAMSFSHQAQPVVDTRATVAPVQGNRRMHLARIAWHATLALTLTILLASLPGYADKVTNTQRQLIDAPTSYISIVAIAGALLSVAVALLSISLAIVLFRRRPNDRIAVFASFLLLIYGVVMAGPLEGLHTTLPGGTSDLALTLQAAILTTPILAFLFVFPNGRLVPRWSRWLIAISLILIPASFVYPVSTWFELSQPQTVFFLLLYAVLMAIAIGAQVYRYRRVSTRIERQQTKWVVLGLILWFALLIVVSVPYAVQLNIPEGVPQPWWVPLNELVWWLSLAVLPSALAVALLRHRLWNIDVVINRTLVYGTLTALVVILYVVLVTTFGALFDDSDNTVASIVATVLAAILFQPLRERLQRRVNRMMYGERDDPYAVLSRLSRQLEATLSPDATLATIVETVAQALKLPYVAIALRRADRFNIVAHYGLPINDPIELPLIHQHETIGKLLLASRASNESFTPVEQRLLDDVARQAGVAVYVVQLTRDLQRSRERLVSAREEERRRLRRDLHDGLGPTLASQSLMLEAVSKVQAHDPDRATALLHDLKEQSQAAIRDIRRVVYDLRPPALDELGLAGALREQTQHYRQSSVRFTLDAPEQLSDLSAAVEVAAYRIVQEAITNVVKHAQAQSCVVRLIPSASELHITIVDDGMGLPVQRHLGVGIQSMRERADELGGRCLIKSRAEGGTCVEAWLPLHTQEG